jgi:hypothetical protein
LGGPQIQSGRGDEEKNSQPLPGLEPPIIIECTNFLFDEPSFKEEPVSNKELYLTGTDLNENTVYAQYHISSKSVDMKHAEGRVDTAC